MSLLGPNILLNTMFSNTLGFLSSRNVNDQISHTYVILSCRCWIFLIFSAYTLFLMYPHRKKSSGERSGLGGGQGIGPHLPIQASGNLSFKTSVTKQL